MFVSRKTLFGKPFSKLSCVCLSLEKLVNGKYFLVNEKHFSVNENTFRSTKNILVKEKFDLVFKKVFSFSCVCFSKSSFGKSLSKLSCICLPLEKFNNRKHFPVKGKFGLVFRKMFSWKIWAENTFRKLWKIWKCHYLLIISNLIFKLLIAIYIVLNIYFSISSLKILFLY